MGKRLILFFFKACSYAKINIFSLTYSIGLFIHVDGIYQFYSAVKSSAVSPI